MASTSCSEFNGQFIHFSTDSNQLSSNNVIVLFRDSRQRMWAATREGLNLFLSDKNSFQSFSTDNGLADNTIRSILKKTTGTNYGSARYQWAFPDTVSFLRRPGRQQPSVRTTRASASAAGTITNRMGCKEGVQRAVWTGDQGRIPAIRRTLTDSTSSTPKISSIPVKRPPIVLTDLEIFNKSVHVGEKLDGSCRSSTKRLSETGQITLNHNEDVFSIEFASLGYIDNARNKYAYTLEEFNKNWLTTDGNIRKATYTNLDAGDIHLQGKGFRPGRGMVSASRPP
jgi:hypothetical protein